MMAKSQQSDEEENYDHGQKHSKASIDIYKHQKEHFRNAVNDNNF